MSPKDVLIADVQENNNDTAIAVTATNGKKREQKALFFNAKIVCFDIHDSIIFHVLREIYCLLITLHLITYNI